MNENTLAKPGEYDALEKAKPDELIFPLLERDPVAPKAILYWVRKRRKMARQIEDGDKRAAELAQITEAEFIAFEMEKRQRGGIASKIAPVATRPGYNGITDPNARRDMMLAKIRAQLGDADYRAKEALDLHDEMITEAEGIDPAVLQMISDGQALIHRAVLELSPHRRALLAEAELPLQAGD